MSAKSTSHDTALTKLAERQMRNWELARTQRAASPVGSGNEVADFITISRVVGAGGDEVAKRVGERLAWPVFDRGILEVMAKDDDTRRRIYASMDERDFGWLEEVLRSFTQPDFIKNDYFHRLTETVLTLARQGSAVFLGRGADLILPRESGLRIRLTAPVDVCVNNFAQERGVPVHEALAEVKRLEAERAGFMQQHFGRDAGDAARYDLTLNMDRFTTNEAVDLILDARRAVGSCEGPS